MQERQLSVLFLTGTILQGKVFEKIGEEGCTDFTWMSCTNSSAHVKDYLSRHLR